MHRAVHVVDAEAIRVVVATSALGEGIDLPDVRQRVLVSFEPKKVFVAAGEQPTGAPAVKLA